jgi:3-deoxy-manno-octulosonate cytidylyltransferase (CMP-KDO synthetase)
MRAVGIIPARYGAQRFPGKPLARETGHYLVEHVWEQAKAAKRLARVLVATDDERIASACKDFGAECVMTPVTCPSGTDRVARAAAEIECDLVLNLQGDEPEMAPDNIDALVGVMERSDCPMGTLVFETADAALWRSPDVVKCVHANGRALYFSRSGLPFDRARAGAPERWWKHLGMYAYRKDFLAKVASLPPSPLEKTEMLEQLRVLEAGYGIAVAPAVSDSNGIDTADQYAEFVIRWRLQHG